MSSMDDPSFMDDIAYGSLNTTFKDQLDNISSNFEDYERRILGDFFTFIDKYILDIKTKECYSGSTIEQDEEKKLP